jgi:hypothetical protein
LRDVFSGRCNCSASSISSSLLSCSKSLRFIRFLNQEAPQSASPARAKCQRVGNHPHRFGVPAHPQARTVLIPLGLSFESGSQQLHMAEMSDVHDRFVLHDASSVPVDAIFSSLARSPGDSLVLFVGRSLSYRGRRLVNGGGVCARPRTGLRRRSPSAYRKGSARANSSSSPGSFGFRGLPG